MSRYEREGVKGALAVWSVLESFTVRHVPDTLVSPKKFLAGLPRSLAETKARRRVRLESVSLYVTCVS
jgi:hypothetical protein